MEAERRPNMSTVQTEGNTTTLPYSSLSRSIQMAARPSPSCTSRHSGEREKTRKTDEDQGTRLHQLCKTRTKGKERPENRPATTL